MMIVIPQKVSELSKHPREVENIVGGPRTSMLFYVRDT